MIFHDLEIQEKFTAALIFLELLMLRTCILTSCAAVFVACGVKETQSSSETKLIPLTQDQAMEDLAALSSGIENYYGPLHYKEKRFGYDFKDLVKKAQEEIKKNQSESDYLAAIKRLTGALEDGHVGVRFKGNTTKVQKYKTGVFLFPLEGKAVIGNINEELPKQLGLAIGDVVTKVNGKDPYSYLDAINSYESLGNPISDLHNIHRVLNVDFYMTELLPKKSKVELQVEKPDGRKVIVELPWIKDKKVTPEDRVFSRSDDMMMVVGSKNRFNEDAKGSLREMGAEEPYFVTPQVKRKFDLVRVAPNADYLKKYHLDAEKVIKEDKYVISAYMYRYNGKSILLVRQPGYTPSLGGETMVKAYKALLDQYDSLADLLIIDQNHNPGGSLLYVQDFFRLFIKKDGIAANMVQAYHADRKWYYSLLEWGKGDEANSDFFGEKALQVEAAIDAGKDMTEFMSLLGGNYLQPHKDYSWEKPILVLADELAGSCGDIFPMLMKGNKIAKIMGEQTMGLGGNVEKVIELPNSLASINLTRGLFSIYQEAGIYSGEALVENNGIKPDIKYTHNIKDFRQGYTDYMKAISEEAVKLTTENNPSEENENTENSEEVENTDD